jgi:ATP-dependent helicase/nuclease subunit B
LLSHLPATSEDWQADAGIGTRIERAYGAGSRPAALSRESALIDTLWRAWGEELAARGLRDPEQLYVEELFSDWALPDSDTGLWLLLGLETLPAERAWAARLSESGAEVLSLTDAPGETAASQCLDLAFAADTTVLPERARAAAQRWPQSPLRERLRVAAATDAEQQARTVALQVRLWLQAGRTPIGILTEDRRLARRIRALLERVGISLQDPAGWALSTTSAAAALERWLEAVETDMAQGPLLDVLKSPFLLAGDAQAQGLRAVYRLERDIIVHEGIARGLARYRRQLERRARRLPDWAAAASGPVGALLDRIEGAARPLAPLLRGGEHPAARYLQALSESLDALGLAEGLAEDAAGAGVLEVIEALAAAAGEESLRLDWGEFRGWLGRSLETSYFRPSPQPGPVMLLAPEQAQGERFAGLILAGMDRGQLPGQERPLPFLNEGVRRELGLPTREDRLAQRRAAFLRWLQGADEVVITHAREQDGEPLGPSPWVDLIQTFHALAWGDDLGDAQLPAWGAGTSPHAEGADDAADWPIERPAPPAPQRHLPSSLSVSALQRLIDCPYRFFAADCLGLSAPQEIVEALQKSDYGARVHRCLQALHGDVDALPGPYTGPWTTSARDEIVALLNEIAERVFARDLDEHFAHRGWLQRWQALIPDYVDWQITRAQDWVPGAAEIEREVEVGGWRLHGRLDRVDTSADGHAVLDYKTGATPSRKDILAGEAVQLPSYALLQDGATRVEYLALRAREPVKGEGVITDAALADLVAASRDRLSALHAGLRQAAPLPAWGDEATCARCEMIGLCRRPHWQ